MNQISSNDMKRLIDTADELYELAHVTYADHAYEMLSLTHSGVTRFYVVTYGLNSAEISLAEVSYAVDNVLSGEVFESNHEAKLCMVEMLIKGDF